MMMPAAVLVLLILGGIAFDYAHLYLAKRELVALAEGAANDAVTFGADPASVRRGEGFVLDEARIIESVRSSLAVHSPALHLIDEPDVVLETPTRVRVTLRATIDYVFTRAVPGARDAETVTVTATADVRRN
jgi:Flp pilus assembly protein TadG